jgi:hypothetical protein
MSDMFLDRLLAGTSPIEREVTFRLPDGRVETGTVHFRRITAGERAQILAGQKYQVNRANAASNVETEIDLGQNERQKHMLVAFSVCRDDGKPYFKGASDVAKYDAAFVEALYNVATEVNAEHDAGKA